MFIMFSNIPHHPQVLCRLNTVQNIVAKSQFTGLRLTRNQPRVPKREWSKRSLVTCSVQRRVHFQMHFFYYRDKHHEVLQEPNQDQVVHHAPASRYNDIDLLEPDLRVAIEKTKKLSSYRAKHHGRPKSCRLKVKRNTMFRPASTMIVTCYSRIF